MQATITGQESNRVKVVVALEESEVDQAIDRAAVSLATQVNVKGFRRGKVPKNVLVAHLGGPAVLRAEAIREAVPTFYARAVDETGIDPIGEPDVNVVEGEDSGPVRFEVDVEVRPEPEIHGYEGLQVTLPSPHVSDTEIEALIDRYRETDATLAPVDRPIVNGDVVTMDLRVDRPEGDEPLTMNDYMYTVGSNALLPGADEQILGLRAGEDLSLEGPVGSATGTYHVHLSQVQERVMPDLTDDWVQENTEWPSVAEMRDGLVLQVRRRKILETRLAERDAALLALGELVGEDVVPEVLATRETNERLHDLGHRLADQKLELNDFLRATNQTPDGLLAALRTEAVRAVRIDLALRALVRAESLEPTDAEVDEELVSTAEAMATSADSLRTDLHESGRMSAFRAEVAKNKAGQWLRDHVTYVDPEGVAIDLSRLGDDDEPADA